jgi:hypothetical protein
VPSWIPGAKIGFKVDENIQKMMDEALRLPLMTATRGRSGGGSTDTIWMQLWMTSYRR